MRVLRSEMWELGVLPETGASLAFGRVRLASGPVEILRPTPAVALGRVSRTASFPLVPWSNRIPNGRLEVGSRSWQLRRNSDDGTAEHGTVTEYPWETVDSADDHIVLSLSTSGLVGLNFPWRFGAEVAYRVDGPTLQVTTTVTNRDEEPFPAGMGHHPYFQRRLAPGAPPASLAISASAAYPLKHCVATGPAAAVEGRTDFREPRPVGEQALDDCFTGFRSQHRATIDHGHLRVTMTAEPALSHVVAYVPHGREYFAIEPVTHANGAHQLQRQGVAGHGLRELAPGESWTVQWRLIAAEV